MGVQMMGALSFTGHRTGHHPVAHTTVLPTTHHQAVPQHHQRPLSSSPHHLTVHLHLHHQSTRNDSTGHYKSQTQKQQYRSVQKSKSISRHLTAHPHLHHHSTWNDSTGQYKSHNPPGTPIQQCVTKTFFSTSPNQTNWAGDGKNLFVYQFNWASADLHFTVDK